MAPQAYRGVLQGQSNLEESTGVDIQDVLKQEVTNRLPGHTMPATTRVLRIYLRATGPPTIRVLRLMLDSRKNNIFAARPFRTRRNIIALHGIALQLVVSNPTRHPGANTFGLSL